MIELKKGWDLFEGGMFMWLLRMSLCGRIWLLVLEPPCTTFSIARCPKLRSKGEPEGFDPVEYETLQGNIFLVMCTLLAIAQWTAGNDCLYEQPATGFSKFTCWFSLLRYLGFSSLVTPFCGYLKGCPIVYKKDTLFLHLGKYWDQLVRPCTCVKPHTRLEGSLTTLASAYPDQLCRLIAVIAERNFPGGEGPWGDLEGRADSVPGAAPTAARPSALARRRIKGSELFAVVLSECLPWSVILKQPFKRFGHINIQEARAYRAVLRRVPSLRRFCVMQDSQVNLSVEAKGRSSSIALNRVVCQTSMDVVGRELYPKAFHGPTWSLRADAPSRNRAVERPRLCWPAWLFDLAAGGEEREARAVAELDAMPVVSKAELRWVQFTLHLADALGILLGRGLRSTTCADQSPRLCSDSQGPSGGGNRCEEGAAGGAARPVYTGADGVGDVGDASEGGPAVALDADPRIWFSALRDAASSGGPPRCTSGSPGLVWFCASRTGRELASDSHLGKVGTERGADPFTASGASCMQGRRIGMELATDSASVASGLFLLVEAGGALRASAQQHFAQHHGEGRGVAPADREGQVVVPPGARPVRETGRAARLRILRGFREDHAPFGSFVAEFGRCLRRTTAGSG